MSANFCCMHCGIRKKHAFWDLITWYQPPPGTTTIPIASWGLCSVWGHVWPATQSEVRASEAKEIQAPWWKQLLRVHQSGGVGVRKQVSPHGNCYLPLVVADEAFAPSISTDSRGRADADTGLTSTMVHLSLCQKKCQSHNMRVDKENYIALP